MNLKDAQKALEKLNWNPGGERFDKRSDEDQKIIIEATTILAKSRTTYQKPTKAKKRAKTGDENA